MGILERLSPHTRVMAAVGPFLIASVVRFIYGKNQRTSILLCAATLWFAANVFVAPYSYAVRQDLVNLRRTLLR